MSRVCPELFLIYRQTSEKLFAFQSYLRPCIASSTASTLLLLPSWSFLFFPPYFAPWPPIVCLCSMHSTMTMMTMKKRGTTLTGTSSLLVPGNSGHRPRGATTASKNCSGWRGASCIPPTPPPRLLLLLLRLPLHRRHLLLLHRTTLSVSAVRSFIAGIHPSTHQQQPPTSPTVTVIGCPATLFGPRYENFIHFLASYCNLIIKDESYDYFFDIISCTQNQIYLENNIIINIMIDIF